MQERLNFKFCNKNYISDVLKMFFLARQLVTIHRQLYCAYSTQRTVGLSHAASLGNWSTEAKRQSLTSLAAKHDTDLNQPLSHRVTT